MNIYISFYLLFIILKMEETNINKNINYSLELLRLILSFWVVAHHCYKYVYIFSKVTFHVPIFMIMSFYFYYKVLKTKNSIKIKKRFLRILFPYIVWPILFFISNNIIFKLFGFSQYKRKLSLKDLLLQLIFGLNFHIVFYYQFILIILTIAFTIISLLFHKNFVFIFLILLIIAYSFQYDYWNLYIFNQYSGVIKYSLGNILELLPFSVTGIAICHLNIITKLKALKELSIFFSLVIIFMIVKFDIFVRIKGFWYPGILLNIGGICIFIIFSLVSFQNKILIFVLKIITKFTGGIYYLHLIIYNILKTKIDLLKKRTFNGILIIYIINYIICYVGNKISYKIKLLKLLFN